MWGRYFVDRVLVSRGQTIFTQALIIIDKRHPRKFVPLKATPLHILIVVMGIYMSRSISFDFHDPITFMLINGKKRKFAERKSATPQLNYTLFLY